MRYFVCVLMLWATGLWAQPNKYADKVKLLEQKGLPYFYNDELRANIDAWVKNENYATSIIAGKQDALNYTFEYAYRTGGLPWFVQFIPAANTGVENFADGGEGGVGMWPLNYTIGKKYSLVLNSYIDERLAPDKSSEAACKYLADLYVIYKDWLKVITAFRITPIRLNQVIRLANNSLDFKDIYEKLSPREREPVLQFYAALVVLNNRDEFGIKAIALPVIQSDTVSTDEPLPFSMIEEFTGIKAEMIGKLNPHLKTTLVPHFGSTFYFNVPLAQKADYNRMRDTLMGIIRNRRNPPVIMDTIRTFVDSVEYIEVRPRAEHTVLPGPVVSKTPPMNSKVWVWYSVKSGDGLYTLSDVFDCSMQELKSWNNMRGNLITVGQSLKFYVPSARLAYYKKINGMGAAQKRTLAAKD